MVFHALRSADVSCLVEPFAAPAAACWPIAGTERPSSKTAKPRRAMEGYMEASGEGCGVKSRRRALGARRLLRTTSVTDIVGHAPDARRTSYPPRIGRRRAPRLCHRAGSGNDDGRTDPHGAGHALRLHPEDAQREAH